MVDWYENRDNIKIGDRFITHDGRIVEIDRHVPGDATKMYVLSYYNNNFFADDDTVEPGDLKERLQT